MRNHSSTHTHSFGIFICSGVYIVLGSQYAMHILMKMTRKPRYNTACLRGGILPSPRTLLPSQMSASTLCTEADFALDQHRFTWCGGHKSNQNAFALD